MSSNKNKYCLFVVVIGFLTTNSAYAQNYKKLDSILKTANNEIYSNPDNVIKIGEKVVKQAENNVDYKIKGYKLISDGYSAKRNYEKSLEYLIKSSQLLNLSKDKLLKINIINKTGIQYHQLKVYDKAIQYLDQAEELIAEYPYKDSVHTELGKNYLVRGFIYKEKLSCAIAITYLDRGIVELMKVKDVANSSSKISIAVYNKGNCYLLMKNNKLALENFKKAATIAREINAKSLEAFALKGSAKVLFLEGNYKEALEALNKALSLSVGVNDLILNQEIYRGLAENYLALSQWSQFEIYQLKFLETQKLIKDTERTSVSESLGVKEAELKAKKIELSNKFYYLLLILILILILIVLFFYVLVKRKTNEIKIIKDKIYLLQNQKVKEL
ncbi:tetratricopeptide repeat protein [Flavobacterium paronense]|uniref:Tetratricopeptide repeat protein n=1 Tax=Flavobacterium paronense TaxID=1392775 RepID=A0ABV5GHC0_9FLAO|nr:tetratricopeptide repeat protein [Flavobacterium paronense]MDN3676386.1 tetratricopeptide repeat protein [Flavobacterium paronense]